MEAQSNTPVIEDTTNQMAAIDLKGTFDESTSSQPVYGKDDRQDTVFEVPATDSNLTGSSSYQHDETHKSFFYSKAIRGVHYRVLESLQAITGFSARRPVMTLSLVILLSFSLISVGYSTNFELVIDEEILWAPMGSAPAAHSQWIREESNFPEEDRFFVLFFHNKGENILSIPQVRRIFEALDTLRGVPNYDSVCAASDDVGSGNVTTCEINGITRFWNNSMTIYDTTTTENELTVAMSKSRYPDGRPVFSDQLIGYAERENNLLVAAQSFVLRLSIPRTDAAADFEIEAVEALLDLRQHWMSQNLNVTLELQAEGSLATEFERAIAEDIPKIPLVFLLMSLFVAFVFWKRNPVRSRSGLGIAAVVCILLSIVSGYGLLFCIGVPFSSISQLIPFLTFGIGCDDALIIAGAYERTKGHVIDRIAETIDEVGLSITLTTLTSATAFGLGCLSSIPAVYWLCLYSCPMIVLVFLFQLTGFVACIVLEERRIQCCRRDLLFCKMGHGTDEDTTEPQEHIADRIMATYADILLRPWVKVVVVVIFAMLLGVCAWSTSNLQQYFKFTDILPSDSYITDLAGALELYRDSGLVDPSVYFRDVDQSSVETRAQMKEYMESLKSLDFVELAGFFWVDSFELYTVFTPGVSNQTFAEQMDGFLTNPVFRELHLHDIALDEEGNVIASRGRIRMQVDLDDVQDTINALEAQRNVSASFSMNEGRDDLVFFSYDPIYLIWHFFSIAVQELALTTVVSILSVTLVGFLFIPHWSAVFFLFPLVCILYIDLLGVMQFGGININAVSYVALAMSIGLLVDFMMHVLFKYYESPGTRREKTVTMLRTMGASILLGGTTTFLGTIPLMFTASDAFETIFVTFLGISTLGMGHGLILLPVVLSTIGPEDQIVSVSTRRVCL